MALNGERPMGHMTSGAGPRRITILGATGSIGSSTLDLIRRNPDAYVVEALTANSDWKALAALAREFRVAFVAIGDARHYDALKDALAGTGTEIDCGPGALVEAAKRPADWVMAAIVGAAGLEPTAHLLNLPAPPPGSLLRRGRGAPKAALALLRSNKV